MPSLTYTPGVLKFTPGSFIPEPVRFTFDPAVLSLTGGSFDVGPTLSSELDASISSILDTLFAGEAIVDDKGRPTRRFQQIWQNTIDGIKEILKSQGGSIAGLQDALDAITQAQNTASQAVQTANAVAARIDLANSYTDPASVLTASSDGTITIAAHDRVYDNGTRVSVNGGSLSGFTAGQFIRVYYVDAARAGGAVAFKGTTDEITQSGDTHVVGGVTIPAAGTVDAAGTGILPPGFVIDWSTIPIF